MSSALSCKFPLTVKRKGKQIILTYELPVDVKSNITIKARATSPKVTRKKGIVIVYREKIQ